MLIAQINGKRTYATKGANGGVCPYCKSEVVAKCGEIKVAHWAHKSNKNCDSWHEKESDWHLMWKNYFPQEWQEIIMHDENGEKHIADVCTQNGFILEFQHSLIKPEERLSREKFYKNMNWVVDGTRCKSYYEKFAKEIKNAIIISRITADSQREVGVQAGYNSNGQEVFPTHIGNLLQIYQLDKLLPKNWLNSSVPVVFDFKGLNEINEPNDLRQFVFCLLPIKDNLYGYIIQIPIQIFIQTAQICLWKSVVNNCINELKKTINYMSKQKSAQLQTMSYFIHNQSKYHRPKFTTRKPPRRF